MNRIERINDELRDLLAEIFARNLNFKKGIFVSVIKVDTSKDLRYSKALLSVYPSNEQNYAQKTLEKEASKIRKLLASKLKIKFIPKIDYLFSDNQERVAEIEELFRKIKQENGETS